MTRTLKSCASFPKSPWHPEDARKTSAETQVHEVTYKGRMLTGLHPPSGMGYADGSAATQPRDGPVSAERLMKQKDAHGVILTKETEDIQNDLNF